MENKKKISIEAPRDIIYTFKKREKNVKSSLTLYAHKCTY